MTNLNKKLILVISIFLSFTAISFGQHNLNGLMIKPDFTSKVSEKGIINFLPLLRNKFNNSENVVPKPFGVAFSSLIYQQNFVSKDLRIQGTTVTGYDIYARGDSVTQSTVAGELKANVRPGIWIFPFLNVYGIIGYTSGEIRPDLFVDGIIIEDLPGIGDYYIDTTFVLNDVIKYHGSTYGFGATLNIGFRSYSLLIDYNYSVTSPSDLEGKLYNHFFSPKFAWQWSNSKQNIIFSNWVGALYLSNNQSFTGEITVSEISEDLVPIFGEYAQYHGNIEAKNDWNALIGIAANINNTHLISVELGFINRMQASLSYCIMF